MRSANFFVPSHPVKKLLGYMTAFVLLTVVGCGQSYPPSLQAADSLMNERPDSALALLDGMEADMASAAKSVRMRYQLLRHKAMNKAYVPFTSDSLMLLVTSYYDDHGTANDRMLARYLLGCVYRDLGEVPHAIDCYLYAVAEADTTAADCDFRTLSSVCSQMAWLYHKQLLYVKEADAHKQSEGFAELAKDTFLAIYEKGIHAGTLVSLNFKDSARKELQRTITLYRKYGYEQDALQTSTMLMFLYIDNPHHLPELKLLIDEYEAKSELFNERHELNSSKRQFYYYKAKYFEGINNLDSAEYYYRKMSYPNMPYTYQDSMYKGLMSIFSKKNQIDSLAKYSRLYGAVNDSSVIIRDQQQTAQLAASYDYQYYKNQSLANENRVLWISIVLIVIFNMSILTIVLLVRLHRRYKVIQEKRIAKMSEAYKQTETKHRQEANQLRDSIAEITEMYRQKQAALHQLEEAHHTVLTKAQADLEKVIAENNASHSHLKEARQAIEEQKRQYTQTKENLLEEISVLKKQISQMTLSQQQALSLDLSETPIINMLKSMKEPYRVLTRSECKALRAAFAKSYPALIYDIDKKAKLNQQDITICLLTVLGFEPGRICNLTGRSNSSVTNVRAKINERLFNEKSSPKLYSNLIKGYSIYPI